MKKAKKVKIKYFEDFEFSYNQNAKLKKMRLILIIIIIIIVMLLPFVIFKKNLFGLGSQSKKYDYLIVGSGLFGATFNYFAKKAGKKTLVLEKKFHIGGNLYCVQVGGVNCHKYGPHVFHTDNKKVWDFVNNLTNFNPFVLQKVSLSKNKLYDLPFNMWTFNQLWDIASPEEAKKKINENKSKEKISNLEETVLNSLGKESYTKLIKYYSEKKWGKKSEELSAEIIDKIPKRFTFDGNYYNDRYQGIPEGCYNALINKLLENTQVIINLDYNKFRDKYSDIADTIVYTGRIDEYFDYEYGKLQYRSMIYKSEFFYNTNLQGAAIINYPDKDVPYTRKIEYKHFEPYNTKLQKSESTVIYTEYSTEWDEGKEPSFPINDEINMNLYEKYKKLASKEKNVIFGGRLAEYKHLDMDDIIEEVFKLWKY